MPGGQQQGLLRPPSTDFGRSDGNSSIQANDTSSNRAQSADRSSPRRLALEPSSSSGRRPHISCPAQSAQNKASMTHDLAGLIDDTGPTSEALRVTFRGLKRPRDDSPKDEPPKKRDKLQQELEEMATMHRRESPRDGEDKSPANRVEPRPNQYGADDPTRRQLPIRSPSRSNYAHETREVNWGGETGEAQPFLERRTTRSSYKST